MSADSHDFKFTDACERELIRQDAADTAANAPMENTAALLKWLLAVALAIGSLFVIASNDL